MCFVALIVMMKGGASVVSMCRSLGTSKGHRPSHTPYTSSSYFVCISDSQSTHSYSKILRSRSLRGICQFKNSDSGDVLQRAHLTHLIQRPFASRPVKTKIYSLKPTTSPNHPNIWAVSIRSNLISQCNLII